MKLSKWILGAALLFSAQVTSVQGASCGPCDPCYESKSCDLCDIDFCDVEYDFYVDALYWKFCRSELDYDDDDSHGFGDHGWLWGYRLGGIARYDQWDLGLRYTSFSDSFKKDLDGEDFKHDFDYDVLDIEAGFSCCVCDGLTLRPLAGVKLAWIDDRLKDEDTGFDSKIDYNGYGLYLGLSGRWDLCSYCMCDRDIPLALVTRATTGLLHGKFCYDYDDGSEEDYEDECLFNPVHDLYIGLDMSFCDLCGCGDAFFQIGYEAQYWGSWREHDGDSEIASWGLGGLVLRFGLGF